MVDRWNDMGFFLDLQPAIIAMDGPAASGKSTVGSKLAHLINFLFFDTGVMYRAVTWAVLDTNVDSQMQAEVGRIAQQMQIDIQAPSADESDGRHNTILIYRQDVTWQLFTPQVDQNVSFVAANPIVRRALTEQQRRIALCNGTGNATANGMDNANRSSITRSGIIMAGRDIGTVVVPEAPLKIYLDASPEERANRRYQEQIDRGREADYNQILDDIYKRDKRDSERAIAPLRPADDAIVIDTSGLTIDEVVEKVLNLRF